jgi:hypothetical protein
MEYEAAVKRIFGWWRIRHLRGDTILESPNKMALAVRILFQADGSRIEIPMNRIIKFGPAREMSIRADIKNETGNK